MKPIVCEDPRRSTARSSDIRLSRVGPIVTTALTALMLAGCGKKDQQAGAPTGGMMATPVTAIAAVSREVPVYIDEIGKATASETVTVEPQVSGKIVSRKFEDGADLKKGQLLFQVDPRPFQAALDQAQGQLAKDEAVKASADWNVSQDQAALENKAISQQQLHTDIATRDGAVGSIAVDKAAIETAKLNLEYCDITSPLDGRASSRLVDAGNVVNGGTMSGTQLLVINRVDPIYVDFTVTEAELARVQQFMSAGTLEVTVATPADAQMAAASESAMVAPGGAPPGPPVLAFQARTGKLIFLDNTVQDASGTVRLRAELTNNDHHFWPGQFVDVRLILTKKNSVLIPASAKQISQQGLFVYRVSPNDKSPTKFIAAMQPVTIGQSQGDDVVVEQGLAGGDQVVSSGFTLLQPDAPIMVIPSGPPAAPTPPTGAPKVGPGDLSAPHNEGQAKSGPQASAANLYDSEGGSL